MKHTEGKLKYWSDRHSVGSINGFFIAPTDKLPTLAHVYNYPDKTEANVKRIVDCWNGCAGIENPLAVGELLEVCKKMANFLYGYSESEKRVSSKDYPKFKEIYIQGFNAIDKAEWR